MNKRIRLALLILLAACCLIFVSCDTNQTEALPTPTDLLPTETESENQVIQTFQQQIPSPSATPSETSYERVAYAGDNVPVSRGLVAKMLSLINSDISEITQMTREIAFTDTSPDAWYDKYINAAVSQGLMSGGGKEFMPDKPLTINQAQLLLDKIDPNNKIKIQITDENKDKAISYALWTDLYYKLLTNLSGDKSISEKFGINLSDIIILATPGNNKKLTGWNMITANGPMTYDGLSMDDYIDKKISILKKDSEVIAFLGVSDNAPVIKNAYIVSMTGQAITIFSGGAERTYSYNLQNLPNGRVCDIKINGSNAEAINIYNESLSGTIKKATSSAIELEGKGELKLDSDTKIYSVLDGVPKWKTISAVTMGTDIADYIVDNGRVCAILIVKTTLPQKIRIAINTSGYKGLIHDSVSITSDGDFNVRIGKETKKYTAKEVFTISKSDDNVFVEDIKRIYIEPAKNDGKLQITSITRNWPNSESPKYRGKLEIGLEDEGYSIINETTIDEYLYAVVPSEMPTSHGLEAAKVQAVTARSYAYNQYYANRFYKYGANIDDSVSCQVYNNIPENETSIKAVKETSGECLTYNNAVISANYFSTSCGVTANAGDVWAGPTGAFPIDSAIYLKSVKQYTSGDYGDLSQEENAYKFLKDTNVKSYDSGFPWFRWNVEMTSEEIAVSINSNIKSRYAANKKLILTFDPDKNVYKSLPIDSIGDLVDMEVIERGQGGNILKLKITGTKATVLVLTEYNIRMLIKPTPATSGGKTIVMNRVDNTTVNNYSLMPSAFFVFDKTTDDKGKLTKITFYGGGNGHGVGMSQEGVKGMIDAGFKFEEILKHFYQGTQIKKMI